MNWRDNHDDPPEDADIAALIVLVLFVVVPRLAEVWP